MSLTLKESNSFYSQQIPSFPINSILSPTSTPVETKNFHSFFHAKVKIQHKSLTSRASRMKEVRLKKGSEDKEKKEVNEIGGRKEKVKDNIKYQVRHRKIKSDHQNRSKIKKHLIESIDFQEIQNKLYKKRQWLTKYEYFYSKLQQKKSSNQFHSHLSPLKKKNELTPTIFTNLTTVNVRETRKKKFWIREKGEKAKEEKGCLQGRSLKNMQSI